MKKAKDGTGRGNPEIYRHSNNDLKIANKTRTAKADAFALKIYNLAKNEHPERKGYTQLADTLDAEREQTANGKGKWNATMVKRIFDRVEKKGLKSNEN